MGTGAYFRGALEKLYRVLILSIIAVLLFNLSNSIPSNETEVKSANVPWPIADGTFIQPYLVNGWNDKKWQSELSVLKEAGMHYIILQSTADRVDGGAVMTVYPTKIKGFKMYKNYSNVVDACLRNAEKAGIKVFVGLNFDNYWWDWHARDPSWVYARMDEGNALAAELYDTYHDKYPDAFYGWYWPWEVDNVTFGTRIQQQLLSNALNINLRFLKSTGRRLPFMLSPYMNSMFGYPDDYRDMWVNIFSSTDFEKGDIFCPQDSVGAGGLDIRALGQWFYSLRQAVNTKPGLLFWSDTEIFDSEGYNSATLDRFVAQMKSVQPYVDNIVTFAYSHYYSPNITSTGFHEDYLYYIKNGELENNIPEAPSRLRKVKLSNGDISLIWKAPREVSNICGYMVFRDGKLIKRIQVQRDTKGNAPDTYFIDSTEGRSIKLKYEVKAYSFSGIISQ